MIREAVVAGQFYPAQAGQLRVMIKSMIEENADRTDAAGLLLPHAGYVYSGRVVGAVLSRVKLKDVFVIMCPNHTGRGKMFSVMTEGSYRTPLGDVAIDSELARNVVSASRYLEEDVVAHLMEHAIEVQLPFLQYFKPDVNIVPIVLAQGNLETYREIGRSISRALKDLKREAVVVASSDMTHYEPQESARQKDSLAIQAILDMNEDELYKRVNRLDITMCGYGPAVAMLAACKALGATRSELVKYQTSGDSSGDYSSVVGYAGVMVLPMSPIARLARDTVEMYVREGKTPRVVELTPEMKQRAGVFVSIHKKGALRGCIGTFEPQTENVAQEIIANAVSAATRDPRFFPVTENELNDLEYSVDVLTRPLPVEDPSKLDPKKHGLIVECGWRRGLLLPDLEGVDSVEQQYEICCQKAGISPEEKTNLYCFEVKRYK